MLGVYGSNPKVGQVMDLETSSSEGRIVILNIADVSVRDPSSEVFRGTVILRLKTPVSQESLMVLGRLIQGPKGLFGIVVRGSIQTHGSYSEIYADQVLSTNFQPNNSEKASVSPDGMRRSAR